MTCQIVVNSVYYVVDLHHNSNYKNIANHVVELIILTILTTHMLYEIWFRWLYVHCANIYGIIRTKKKRMKVSIHKKLALL